MQVSQVFASDSISGTVNGMLVCCSAGRSMMSLPVHVKVDCHSGLVSIHFTMTAHALHSLACPANADTENSWRRQGRLCSKKVAIVLRT